MQNNRFHLLSFKNFEGKEIKIDELFQEKYAILSQLYNDILGRVAGKEIKDLSIIGPFDRTNDILFTAKIYNNKIYFGLVNNDKITFTEDVNVLYNFSKAEADKIDSNVRSYIDYNQKNISHDMMTHADELWTDEIKKILNKIQQVEKEISLYNDKSQEMANADLYMDEYIDQLITLYEDNDLTGLKIELGKKPEFYKMLPRVLEQDLKGIDIANNDKDKER